MKLRSRILFMILFIASIHILESVLSSSVDDGDDQKLAQRVKSLVIVIISQENRHHHDKALKLQQELYKQADQIAKVRPVVHISHIDFPHVGAWTFIPIMPKLAKMHGSNSTAVVFLQDLTFLHLEKFLSIMEKYDNKSSFIGFALHDNEPSIIHHFAFYDDTKQFKYPNQASGFVITMPLLLNLSQRIISETPKTDFSIDAAHELALFIWDEGNGTVLTHEDSLCAELPLASYGSIECASYPQPFIPCGQPVQKDEIYFAVKTCKKFHKERVPVVKSTWFKHAKFIKFFSDDEDTSIPSINLGVPNTEHGHCEKTFAIIDYVIKDIQQIQKEQGVNIKWVMLVDDDTILSVSHITRLLSCYDSSDNIVLGERYGYGVRTRKGYNYITGGGGTVISRALLPLLADMCECPSSNTPDDMYLGFCLRELHMNTVHSPLFHQARPNDYADNFLKSYEINTVSFHKYWMIDPIKVYRTWFEEADQSLLRSFKLETHEEL